MEWDEALLDPAGPFAKALDELIAERGPQHELRGWVPRCSTGEAADALASMLQAACDRAGRTFTGRIYATDVDADALATARATCRMRDRVVFGLHDLELDPALWKIDVLYCPTLTLALAKLSFSLEAGGLLVIDPTTKLAPAMFDRVAMRHGIARRRASQQRAALPNRSEQLASAIEQLETSRRILALLDDELKRTREELAAMARADDDLRNVLDHAEDAILLLDAGLRVRNFTRHTSRVLPVIPNDVGRPVSELVACLDYPTLAADADAVLKTLEPAERDIDREDGIRFRARMLPYRTKDRAIDGLVLTFR